MILQVPPPKSRNQHLRLGALKTWTMTDHTCKSCESKSAAPPPVEKPTPNPRSTVTGEAASDWKTAILSAVKWWCSTTPVTWSIIPWMSINRHLGWSSRIFSPSGFMTKNSFPSTVVVMKHLVLRVVLLLDLGIDESSQTSSDLVFRQHTPSLGSVHPSGLV